MQNASKAYKQAMKKPLRNRAYINITIGVINQNAQKTAKVDSSETPLACFSSPSKPFNNYELDSLYATAEQGFAMVDGSMVFLPREISDAIMNNGIIARDLLGSILIVFGISDLDIKGLTIDFGECYPTKFTVETDTETKTYENLSAKWTTEDVFSGVSYIKITPVSMVNGQGRLRIYEFLCGVGNVFTNKDVKSYSWKDYVSPISESLPSQDMSISVYNFSQKYNVDNPDSAFNFMELGQEISVSFGYDVTGNGDIEWIASNEAYLKTWDADDSHAKFTASDQFDNINSTYYRGRFRKDGITAYDLAVDIFSDMGLEERQYMIDPYLKTILIYNPMPVVPHVEALQILANACRCVLFQNRDKKVQIKSSFVPDMEASSENQIFCSHVENILKIGSKTTYAASFRNFAKTDRSMMFLPREPSDISLETGYVSNSMCDENGAFAENPVITVSLESAYTCYGLLLSFQSVAPEDFVIRTYNNKSLVSTYEVVANEDLEYITNDSFENFDEMEIEFTKGAPNSRIALDFLKFGDVTDYHLGYGLDLTSTPKGVNQDKLKSMTVIRTLYSESTEESKQLLSEDMVISPTENIKTLYFSNASYALEALFAIEDADKNVTYSKNLENGVSVSILEASDFYVVLQFSGVTSEQTVSIVANGKEYQITKSRYTVQHGTIGEEIEWENKLISTAQHAVDLEEWISDYYMNPVEYQYSYRGDPRIDANDLFYLELKNRDESMVRCYQNELKYSGAWSGTMKARKVVGV